MSKRQPMTPSEFDAACRTLERSCPWLRQTSGYRGPAHNKRVNGADGSKHLISMARDYGAETTGELREAMGIARGLGFWVDVHDKGSGNHLHIQGLPPGNIDEWWVSKYFRVA